MKLSLSLVLLISFALASCNADTEPVFEEGPIIPIDEIVRIGVDQEFLLVVQAFQVFPSGGYSVAAEKSIDGNEMHIKLLGIQTPAPNSFQADVQTIPRYRTRLPVDRRDLELFLEYGEDIDTYQIRWDNSTYVIEPAIGIFSKAE